MTTRQDVGRVIRRGTIAALNWEGPSLLTDDRPAAEKPFTMVVGQHALAGFELPFLPEPVDVASISSDRYERHRSLLLHELARMVRGLHRPDVWHGRSWERHVPVRTFDLRLSSRPGRAGGPGRVRIFLLAKAFVASYESRTRDEDRARALDGVVHSLGLCRALAPRMLTLQPLLWTHHDDNIDDDLAEDVGLRCDLAAVGELRRENLFSSPHFDGDYQTFSGNLAAASNPHAETGVAHIALPVEWPQSGHDLASTCNVMVASSSRIVLSVRLQPTMRTSMEREALVRRGGQLRAQRLSGTSGEEAMGRATERISQLLGQEEVFLASVQVAAENPDTVREVLTTLASEQGTDTGLLSAPPHGRPALVACVHRKETDVAQFNLSRLEFWPWGAVDGRVQDASRPSGNQPSGSPDLSGFAAPDELRVPEVFLQRDLDSEPGLLRLRALLSVSEASSVWRVPVVGLGGQAGLASRPANPFEQIPSEVPSTNETVSLGVVRHRGVSTGQNYALPLVSRSGAQAGIGDRVIVVAGSPGSGKTNFCLHFLEQLWSDDPDGGRVPYLVIDPTRGGEFRSLARTAPDDVVIFTVGDARAAPFCFNPFILQKDVSLQAHISRLMSCFKAAYYMWDPLPAIFEEAIRRAYRDKLESQGLEWHPSSIFGTGQAAMYPTLSDVCNAMGTGAGGEPGTVLEDERKRWGEGTENQATIIASTSLRLRNLRDNYEHIIGGAKVGRPCVDLTKLLHRPVVLEFGMIGDSQALALLMAFLVVSLVGCIENRDLEQDPLHMLVIEEAHRLLSAEGSSTAEGGNSRIQAAEDINTLLAEVRKYGQGVMLLDQRPGSLVGGVIDNAYLVALHRLNERKSFEQFADMLNLSAEQRRFARVGLEPGETIILDRVSGAPVIVRPPEKHKEKTVYTEKWVRDRSKALVAPLLYPLSDQFDTDEARSQLTLLKATLAGEVDPPPTIYRLSYDLAQDHSDVNLQQEAIAAAIVDHLRLELGASVAATNGGGGSSAVSMAGGARTREDGVRP